MEEWKNKKIEVIHMFALYVHKLKSASIKKK